MKLDKLICKNLEARFLLDANRPDSYSWKKYMSAYEEKKPLEVNSVGFASDQWDKVIRL